MFSSKPELSWSAGLEAKYIVTKRTTFRGSYARVFGIAGDRIVHVDPDAWTVTNTFPFATGALVDFTPNVASSNEFTLTVKDGKKNECVPWWLSPNV